MTIYRCKNDEHTPKNGDFNRKNDVFCKHSEAVIYRNEDLVIYSHAKITFESILRSVNSLDAKPMKTYIYSRQHSRPLHKLIIQLFGIQVTPLIEKQIEDFQFLLNLKSEILKQIIQK